MSKFQVKFKFILIHILLNRKEEEKCKKLMQKKKFIKDFFSDYKLYNYNDYK
jgi:hypothetical protein